MEKIFTNTYLETEIRKIVSKKNKDMAENLDILNDKRQ
jgi:hypothetical protein